MSATIFTRSQKTYQGSTEMPEDKWKESETLENNNEYENQVVWVYKKNERERVTEESF